MPRRMRCTALPVPIRVQVLEICDLLVALASAKANLSTVFTKFFSFKYTLFFDLLFFHFFGFFSFLFDSIRCRLLRFCAYRPSINACIQVVSVLRPSSRIVKLQRVFCFFLDSSDRSSVLLGVWAPKLWFHTPDPRPGPLSRGSAGGSASPCVMIAMKVVFVKKTNSQEKQRQSYIHKVCTIRFLL
jgi:hypothetical protein